MERVNGCERISCFLKIEQHSQTEAADPTFCTVKDVVVCPLLCGNSRVSPVSQVSEIRMVEMRSFTIFAHQHLKEGGCWL